MARWGYALLVLVLLVVLAAVGYIFYARHRARVQGRPPPSFNPFARNRASNTSYRAPAPAPSGIVGWVTDKFSSFRNNRTAGGAYESTGYGGGRGGAGRSRRGFGPLDPDEAWDARVDNEAGGLYEEQELGLQDPEHGPYAGGGYGEVGIGGVEEGRGRSRSRQRELDQRYDEEVHGTTSQGGGLNPFGDDHAAPSLRSLSPRPHVESERPRSAAQHRTKDSLGGTGTDESPTERRSMFREDV